MTAGFDIAVIGGGVIGLSLARELAREGARVGVIDAGTEIPPATRAAAGMLAPSFEIAHGESVQGPDNRIGEALYAFSAASLELWPGFAAALEEESGVAVDLRHDGILGVALDEERAGALRRDAAFLRARGAAVEIIDGDEARRLEPGLSPDIVSALHAPRDGQVDPRRLLSALRLSVERVAGAVIPARVVGCVAAGAGFVARLADGGRVEAARLVLAGGASRLPMVAGVPAPPVRPVKGEAIALATPAGASPDAPGLRRVVRAPGAYLCPKSDGRLVIGATEIEGRADLTVDKAAAAALRAAGARAAPGVAGLPLVERWAGLRPGTPDAAPILGAPRQGPGGLYFALGHYRNGVLLAPASARALADDMLGRDGPFDVAPFHPARFA